MTSVAGDFYDFINIDDKHLGILMADVSGHGLSSALIASMLQVALTAQAAHASEPARVLSGLNEALCGKFTEKFVTAAYVYVDLEKNLLRYAGAGHPPILQYRSSTHKAAKILENGMVLGILNEAAYQDIELRADPGDRYVLYTDGVLEAANSREELYGAERLMHFIERNYILSANAFADSLLAEITSWTSQPTGQSQQDDITLLLFDFKRS
jgi:serine phosphatase RsbU (regulator of sigma subunit)